MQSWSEILCSHKTLRDHTLIYEGFGYWKQPHPVITGIHHNLTLGWLQSKILINLCKIKHILLCKILLCVYSGFQVARPMKWKTKNETDQANLPYSVMFWFGLHSIDEFICLYRCDGTNNLKSTVDKWDKMLKSRNQLSNVKDIVNIVERNKEEK